MSRITYGSQVFSRRKTKKEEKLKNTKQLYKNKNLLPLLLSQPEFWMQLHPLSWVHQAVIFGSSCNKNLIQTTIWLYIIKSSVFWLPTEYAVHRTIFHFEIYSLKIRMHIEFKAKAKAGGGGPPPPIPPPSIHAYEHMNVFLSLEIMRF